MNLSKNVAKEEDVMDANLVQQLKQKALLDAVVSQRDSALNIVCNLQADAAVYNARIQEMENLYSDLMGKYQTAISDRDKYAALIQQAQTAAVSAETQVAELPETQETESQDNNQDEEWQEATTADEVPAPPVRKEHFKKKR